MTKPRTEYADGVPHEELETLVDTWRRLAESTSNQSARAELTVCANELERVIADAE